MKVPVVTVERNIGKGKTTLLQKFQESLSSADKFKNRVEHKPINEFQRFFGNKCINPLEYFVRIQQQMPSSFRITYWIYTMMNVKINQS